jgi:hypothetical protein
MANPSSALLEGADTCFMRLVVATIASRAAKESEPDDGSSNVRTPGPTAVDAYLCAGRRNPRIILRSSICSSLTSHYAPPEFWDRL